MAKCNPPDEHTHGSMRVIAMSPEGARLLEFIDREIASLSNRTDREDDEVKLRRDQGAVQWARGLRAHFETKEKVKPVPVKV